MPTTPELIRYALAPFFTREVGLAILAILVVWLIVLRMRPKRFYLVRHGETLLNVAHRKQGPEGGLSEKGKEQAERVGTALAPFGIERILASPYERARETAEIIRTHVHASIRYSPLLAERRNPSDVLGKSTHDPEVMHIIDEMDLAYHADDYRHRDEENFLDLARRAQKCLRYLAHNGTRHTCVVTHHAFLKMLLAYMQYRRALHSADYVKLSFFNTSDNGGISIVEYHPWHFWNKKRGWEVVSFNETVE